VDGYANALQKPLIFIDEVHRLSKNQQEVLLPYMEKNSALFFGASTQNPYYSLTAAIRSRSMLFELNPITNEVLRDQLTLIEEKEGLTVDEDAAKYLITSSAGDMRAMLKLLEFAVVINTHVTLKTLRSLRPNALQGGSSEDTNHYHLISAMIKSIRGSDPDAAIYYIARMIEGGESADFIARRLVILASEDIGNANPNALVLANSALQTVLQIGFPEARIILAQTAIYLSASPKSNSAYKAINEAQKSVKKGNILPVPPHIQDPPQNYLYPHDFGGWVEQNYLASDDQFVQMKPIGFEKRLIEWLEKIKQIS
jgi:putative ATPase